MFPIFPNYRQLILREESTGRNFVLEGSHRVLFHQGGFALKRAGFLTCCVSQKTYLTVSAGLNEVDRPNTVSVCDGSGGMVCHNIIFFALFPQEEGEVATRFSVG